MGLPSLREKIAEDLNTRNHIPCKAENIVITPGTKQAIILSLMALLEPGDEVVVIMPAWVSYIPQSFIAETQVCV